VDASGGLWVSDTLNHRVLHYTPQPVPATSAAAVALSVTGKTKISTHASAITIKGTASCADGIARVEYRIGKKGGFRTAAGTTAWSFKAKLSPGKNTISIRAVGKTGASAARFVVVKRSGL
jgi:hypothetical protein